jgi:4'-phosphopantetheinyl transferase
MIDVCWLEQFEADVPVDNDWLCTNELAVLDRLRFPKRRADWRLGRWTAKLALATYLDEPDNFYTLERIEIRAAPSGAPDVFLDGKPAPATLSISHRSGAAMCAVARPDVALGCDLEVIEPRSDAFIADYFSASEQASLLRASVADRQLLIALLWSAKESALKALHEGLRIDTRSVVVDPRLSIPIQPETWYPLHVSIASGPSFRGWWQAAGDFLRTVVADPPPQVPVRTKKVPGWLKAYFVGSLAVR